MPPMGGRWGADGGAGARQGVGTRHRLKRETARYPRPGKKRIPFAEPPHIRNGPDSGLKRWEMLPPLRPKNGAACGHPISFIDDGLLKSQFGTTAFGLGG